MKSYKDFLAGRCVLSEDSRQYLEEKLLMLGKGKRYGQVVFLAGGGGSGKGFAASNFMESDKFKVRDVDEWKRLFLRIEKETGKYPELKGLDLRKPGDVFKLHKFTEKLGVKAKTLKTMLQDVHPDRLPNIMFDITAKKLASITDVLPKLQAVGYDANNIHLVWVLRSYRISVAANAKRSRVVPEDILLQTHEGAARTVYDVVTKGTLPRNMMDGGIYVILNNPKNTVYRTDKAGNKLKNTQGRAVIKSFTYLTVKEPNKPIKTEGNVLSQLLTWIRENVPKTKMTADLFK